MAFNGSGVFTRLYSWVVDRNNSVKIDATRQDAELDGIAAGLSNTITRDGQSTIIAAIPFSGQKITGLGDATADQDAVNRRAGDARFQRQIGGGLSPSVSVAASTIDLSVSGRDFYKTISGALTWVFQNPAPTGYRDGFLLELTNGGAAVQTWPSSVKWPGGSPPTLTVAGVDGLVFLTRDGGVTWRGSLSQRNSS